MQLLYIFILINVEFCVLIHIIQCSNIRLGTIPESFGDLSSMRQLRIYQNSLVGSIPLQICELSALTNFDATSAGNPGLTCSPECLTTVSTRYLPDVLCTTLPTAQPTVVPSTATPSTTPSAVPTVIPLSGMDIALCGIIAATNVASVGSYTDWSCETDGHLSSDPCTAPWGGVTCTSGVISHLVLMNIAGM